MTRIERYNIFNEFFANAKKLFTEIDSEYLPHSELRKPYGFHIAPGSRMGGQDKTLVEVLFGIKTYNSSEKMINGQMTTEFATAYGAMLHYRQIDNGYILITIYPACTDTRRAVENFVLLERLKDPRKLLDKKYLARQYQYLVSYLAVTSIEETSRIIDRLKVFYLRNLKKYYSKDNFHESKVKILFYKGIKLILTVGFSGFLLAFIPLFVNFSRNKEVEKKIDILIEKQVEIIDVLHLLCEKQTDNNYSSKIDEVIVQLEELSGNITEIMQDKMLQNQQKD